MTLLTINKSITLIGMAGVGKSTIGRDLANYLSLPFQDTDDDVLKALGTATMIEFISAHNEAKFLQKEEKTLAVLSEEPVRIIATGGSVVYSKKVMGKLSSFSFIVYLSDHIDRIIEKTKNDDPRGTVFRDAPDLTTLFQNRDPLYRRYADLIFQLPETFDKSLITDKLVQEINAYMSSNDQKNDKVV